LKRVSWQELRKVCLLLGCIDSRTKGDHLIMTRPGLARPVVIKMDSDLGEDIIRGNMLTLGLNRRQFDQLLEQIRRKGKKKKGKKS
jgi:predicted RNA binding protein YcfA (HicA-like mRNA interferase family)